MNRNVLILAFTLMVVMLGYGMIQPILPFLITKLGASGRDLGILTSAYAAMQLVFAPLWGSLSDRIGRKPVLLIGALGYAITLFIFGISTRFWMLFLARAASGVLSSAAMPTAMAYVSDNLPSQQRSGAMGKLGAAIGLGVVLGPLLGGLLSNHSLSLPFFVGAALALLALFLILILLPESHPPAPAQDRLRGAGFWQPAALRNTLLSPAGVLLVLVFLISFGMTNFQGIIGLYALARFELDTRQVGMIWMVIGLVMFISQGLLTGWLTRRIGETRVIRASLLVGAAGFGALLLANGFMTLLLAAGIFILAAALMGPALNGYLSNFGGEHQGALMGLNTAFASFGRVFGPLWAGFSFDANPVYPFASGALILLAGFAVSCLWLRELAARPSPASN